jgi:hypothetical protein
MRRICRLFFAYLLVLSLPASAEPQPEERDWTFGITPYIWLPAMTGNLTVAGAKVPVESSISDIFTRSDFFFGLIAEAATT